jgi:threonine dehydratase
MGNDIDTPPTLKDVRAARERIHALVHRTPVVRNRTLDRLVGAELYFKCENLQRGGAFKARGACNAVFSLDACAAARGVVTHSSGNHGAALALAAALRGIPAHIVMPENATQFKQAAVRALGGHIVHCAANQPARERAMEEVRLATGANVVHPFDDYRVIAGQGTVALELQQDVPQLGAILAPVGGGGLLSGIAVVTKGLNPGIRVIGAEPEGADDAHRSLRAGRRIPCADPKTVADGLRMSIGERNFPLLQRYADDIVTVSEAAIVAAMRTAWETLKLVIEPSSAVALAALLEGRFDPEGRRIGVVLTGGNVDLDRLPWQ